LISAQDVVSRELEVIKRLEPLSKLENEIGKVKENHQSECSRLKENLDKNLRLVEGLRQDKLSIQFELNNVKKDYNGFRKKSEEDISEKNEQIRGMEQKSLEEEINSNSLLKEKELIINKLQASLDKLKTIFFEISSVLTITAGTDIPESVKSTVIVMMNELKLLKDDLAKEREISIGYQSKLDAFVENLKGSFLPQKSSNDLSVIAEYLINRERVIELFTQCRTWKLNQMNGLKC
jgi:hypothetical protein